MNNAPIMKVFHSENNLTNVLFGPILRKTTKDLDKRGAITSIEIFHHQVKVVFAGECPVKLCNKVTLALPHHDGAFGFHVGDLIFSDHVGLLQDLHSIVLASSFLLHQINTTKSTFTDRLDDFEIFDR